MRKIIKILIYLMLASGAIFLTYPDQHYNDAGWAVLIKYTIYLPLIGLLALSFLLLDRPMSVPALILTGAWIAVVSGAWIEGAETSRLALYTLPVFATFAPRWVHDAAPKIAYAILWTALFGAIYEYAVLGGFARFHPTGYRAVSVFVNPNNLGITAVILYYFTQPLTYRKRVFAFLIAFGLIISSGSKTGLLCMILLWTARNMRITAIQAAWTVLVTFAAVVGAFRFGFVPLESFYLRLDQYAHFFTEINAVFYPSVEESYADNAFIQAWIELGLLAPLAFIGALAYCAARDGVRRPLWLIFVAASLTTNILYLFPLAYLFWFYAGRVGQTHQKARRQNKSTQPVGRESTAVAVSVSNHHR